MGKRMEWLAQKPEPTISFILFARALEFRVHGTAFRKQGHLPRPWLASDV